MLRHCFSAGTHTDPRWGRLQIASLAIGVLLCGLVGLTGFAISSASGQESPGKVRTLRGHVGHVYSVCFSPDGKRIVSAGGLPQGGDTKVGRQRAKGEIKVWDTETGKELMTLHGHTDRVWSVCFSPDGKRILSASQDRTLKVWDAERGR